MYKTAMGMVLLLAGCNAGALSMSPEGQNMDEDVCKLAETGTMVAIGDFNLDGIPDIAALANGSVDIMLGTLSRTFWNMPSISVNYDSSRVAVFDVNEDGKPDLLVADEKVRSVLVLFGEGTGSFEPAITYQCGR